MASTTTPPGDPAQPASTGTLTGLKNALSLDRPLFLFQDGPEGANGVANGTDVQDDDYDPDAIRLGVMKYQKARLFGFNSTEADASLNVGAMGQFRGYLSYFEPFGGAEDEEFENAFELSRMQIYGHGMLGSPDLHYRVQGNFFDGDFMLQDAWASWRANENWGIRAGQFKNPLTQEGLVWSGHQLATERSLISGLLGDGRVQGISFMYSPNNTMRSEVALHDGFNSQNTSFLGAVNTHFGFSARLEMMMRGQWRDYKDFTAADTEEDLLVAGFGGGMSWDDGDDRDGLLTADLQYENSSGMGAFGAVYYNPSWVDGQELSNFGATVQAGFRVRDDFEPFIRASLVQLDDEVFVIEDTFFEISPGFNWYPIEGRNRHRLKFTTDLNFLPNGSPADIAQLGYVATDEFEMVLRTQVQLAI